MHLIILHSLSINLMRKFDILKNGQCKSGILQYIPIPFETDTRRMQDTYHFVIVPYPRELLNQKLEKKKKNTCLMIFRKSFPLLSAKN